MQIDDITKYFGDISDKIMHNKNTKEISNIFYNIDEPYKEIGKQIGRGSKSSVPKNKYQKLVKTLKNKKEYFIIVVFIIFLFVFFAKNYNGNNILEFLKLHKKNIIDNTQYILQISREKAEKIWNYFFQRKIFTTISKVIEESKKTYGKLFIM